MGLTVDPFRKAAYAGSDAAPAKAGKNGNATDFARVLDEVTISSQKRDALAAVPQGMARAGGLPDNGKMERQSAVIPNKAEFAARAEKARAENRLETNWNAVVDPDGSIYSAAYIGAIVSQYQKAEAAVRDYYGSPHQESLPFDNPCLSVTEKSDEPLSGLFGSSSFLSDMSEAERAVMWGDNVRLNDLYALGSSGGTLHIDEVDRLARSAAQDKLDALIRDWKAAHGITD